MRDWPLVMSWQNVIGGMTRVKELRKNTKRKYLA